MKTNDLGGTAVEIPDDGKSDEERRSEERGYILRLWWQSLVHPIDGASRYTVEAKAERRAAQWLLKELRRLIDAGG